MRFALDCRVVTAPKTGDRTYALGLTRALAELEPAHEYYFYAAEPTSLTEHPQTHCHAITLPASPRWTWTPIRFPLDLRRRGMDLAHVQYLVPPLTPCPIVTTIHDISFRRHPQLFPLKHRVLLNALIPSSIETARVVLTGSEATRRDLMELMGVPEHKIVVTPYAADASFVPMAPDLARAEVWKRFKISGRYVLSVAHIHPRKNLARLVRAWNRIAGRVQQRLVLVGKRGWGNEDLNAAVADADPRNPPIFTGYVADADLPVLYAGADAFAYPSLYEGFGLPPLEAMSCGTAVLTSNVSSLPEVVGSAGVLVDPTDVAEISMGLWGLLEDEAYRRRLGRAGLERARQFSWERCARETVAAYEACFTV